MIEISGGTTEQQRNVVQMINHCIKKLMPRLKDKLCIEVEFDKDLDINGSVIFEDDPYRPRFFYMELNPYLDQDTLLLTVAHEMVHVKQYARNEINLTHSYDYSSSPYEIEAYEKERYLLESYKLNNLDSATV